VSLLGASAARAIRSRYQGTAVPDLGYATVRDFCDSADSLPQVCRLDGDLKNVQRPWMLKAVLGRVPAGGRLLEIGGGEPLVAGALEELGYQVTLVDPYQGAGNGPTAYEAYVRAFPRVRILRAELGPDPGLLAGESFDAVYSVSVLEHVPHDRLGPLFDAIRRHLRPGGQSVHCVDHVVEGWGAEYHRRGLGLVLAHQAALSGPGAADASRADELCAEVEGRMARDVETFYLSALGHHQWRGGRPYDAFPFRKVVSVQTCAAAGGVSPKGGPAT
jgi:SAM-dependent methyltransferase